MASDASDQTQPLSTREGQNGVDAPLPRTVAAWLVLGMVPVERVPWWAAHWLAGGHDGDALRALAGLAAADSHAIHDLLPVALEEAGAPLPSTEIAAAAEAFDHLAAMWRRGQAGERWITQKVEEVVARADYSAAVIDLPLGQLYGDEDSWQGGWGPSADALTETVRAACLQQLGAAMKQTSRRSTATRDNFETMRARAVLSLLPAVRAGEKLAGGGSRTRREFLDFHIDGQSLRDALHKRADTLITVDLVSVVVTNWPGGFPTEEVEMLIGQRPAPFPGGRVALYICPECGGYGCGAVTALIERNNEEVVWRDLGWQTDYDPEVDLDLYRGLGPYRFDANGYEATLRDLHPSG